MFKQIWAALLIGFCLVLYAPAQTTNGLITGSITDATGAVVPGAQVKVVNRDTGQERTAVSDTSGLYVVPQLAPGVYTLTSAKEGFASVKQNNIQLLVNQSLTIDLKVSVASVAQTIEVTTAPPQLNTTSATLSDVIEHQETVDLPLNGREFTQLALLTPGAAPQEDGQQSAFTVSLGSGGISPSVNGQRGEQNNFTMDGVLNNSIFKNTWQVSPPPDAIEEFNVQSHITDAQFSISSGANINLVTRSGTNQYHGDLWEFIRNDVLDAQTYPDTSRLTYRQNQYGVYFGGPLIIPHLIQGKENTWFSGYWEGYRYSKASTQLGNTLTDADRSGDFSGVLGPQAKDANGNPVFDSLGRPEYIDEIYDPTTSRPDPKNPGAFLRDPFPNNTIPTGMLNAATLAYIGRYYPKQNLTAAEGVFPNFKSTNPATIKSDVFGFRLDHQFGPNDTAFLRLNRSNAHQITPQTFNVTNFIVKNYAQVAAVGYTHTFNPKTILNFHYGFNYENDFGNTGTSDPATITAMGLNPQIPLHDGLAFAPQVSLGNSYTSVGNFAIPLGPIQNMDYHLDLSKVVGNHTLGAGGMYYHIRSYDDGWGISTGFTSSGTAQDGNTASNTGFSPASFMLGTLDSYSPWIGDTGTDQTVNWYGWYAQDNWQVNRKLVVTAGIRWDFVSPPNYHKIVSGLNMFTGEACVTGAVAPQFPKATCPSGYFYSQYNGWEPRLGLTYRALNNTVVHGAAAILDDHNNTLVQENQNIRLSWPSAAEPSLTGLDLGSPTGANFSGAVDTGSPGSAYWTGMPAAASLLGAANPFAIGYGANPKNKIPYAIEYNLGIEQQLQEHLTLKVDYVGSMGKHQYVDMNANTAVTPGAGSIQARAKYPQYGSFSDSENMGSSAYNALQVELNKQMSNGLTFKTSYTWSKSMDYQSDPYGLSPVDFYNLKPDWGPSDYNRPQMLVFSGIYQLPVGRGRKFINNANVFTDDVLGGWNVGTIITLDSGQPFTVFANGDIANTGWGSQRAQRVTGKDRYLSGGGGGTAYKQWVNYAAYTNPDQYTLSTNVRKNDMLGPSFKNVDFNLTKNFHLFETANLIFKSEFFNILNHTNYGTPNNGLGSVSFDTNNNYTGSFGNIYGANGLGRLVQFGLKIQF